MTDLDFSRCRYQPFAHQREDTQAVIDNPFLFIASEMRTGKTKIVIDAAQFLYTAGTIDRVLIVTPAPVRDVWFDRQLGEINKHAWSGLPMAVTEYHAYMRGWTTVRGPIPDNSLQWIVTNYEFIRSEDRTRELLEFCGPRTLIVGDESSLLKNHKADQTEAFFALRWSCGRVILLNGTPIYHSPLDLFSQGNILSPSILQCRYVTHFKAKYAVQVPVLKFGGEPMLNKWNKPILKIDKWTNLDDLQRRFAPYTIRRLQKDCLDLPPKLDPVTLTAPLTTSWRAYKEMRDEMVVWLQTHVATSQTAAIRSLRLSQITGGFLGGVEEIGFDATYDATVFDEKESLVGIELKGDVVPIGREKLDVLLWFIENQLEKDSNLHLIAWCRFRPELFRIIEEVKSKFPQFEVGSIVGGQKKADRLRSMALLKPETSPSGPVFVCGIEGTGSFGLDFSAAHTCITVSGGYSPGRSAQTLDRVYGPGQTHPIAYYEIIATGPKGQKTIDKDIVLARRAGQDVADWTAAAWVKALTEE